jgi:hypothetical protein
MNELTSFFGENPVVSSVSAITRYIVDYGRQLNVVLS